LARPTGENAAVEEWQELWQVRGRLLAQLHELDVEEGDHNVDANVVDDERKRLEGELAQVLRRIEHAPKIGRKIQSPGRPARQRWLGTIVTLALGMPLVAGGLYALEQRNVFRYLTDSGVAANQFPPQVLEMVARLEQRLAREPNDPQGWSRLGRAYRVMERPREAREAYVKAHSLAPEDPEILSEFAALVIADNPTRPTAEAQALFQRLHELDPKHPGALWVLGLTAYNEQRFAQALKSWGQLLKMLPPDSEVKPQVRKAIEEAQARIDEQKIRQIK
jgi:cytochrome c-type biogenesis protein CcmH